MHQNVTTGSSLRGIPVPVARGFPVRPKAHIFATHTGVRSLSKMGRELREAIASTSENTDGRTVPLSEKLTRATGNYICTNCGKRGNPRVFDVFVNCPVCGSSRVMDADIWDRFGPKVVETTPVEENKEKNLQTE